MRPIVWVVSPFSDPTDGAHSDRYRYICRALTFRGAAVCQFVSGFDHALKRKRRKTDLQWRCVHVYEPGYRSNVSVRRVVSHAVFDLVLLLALTWELVRGGRRPRTILVTLPHNGAACIAVFVARAVGARLLVDVHDTWPESVLSVVKPHEPFRTGFRLWRNLADFALRNADFVFAESEKYAERANAVRRRTRLPRAETIYLGGDSAYYRSTPAAATLPSAVCGADFLVAYVGTLGANYDLDCVIEAFATFAEECEEAGLLFLGGGEREEEIRERVTSLHLKCWISGRLSHTEMLGYLKRSSVGLNCFRAGGNVAYSYKQNDYLLAGIPVINSLTGETAQMIASGDLGVNYTAGEARTLLAAFRQCRARLVRDPGWNDRIAEFASQRLERSRIYESLLERCMRPS